VNNRNLISGERKTRRRPSKKTDAAPSKQPRRPSKKTDAAPSKQPRINLQGRRGSVQDSTLDVRQQLPRKKFTSQGIPIVANIPAVKNQATNPSVSQKIIPGQTNDLSKNPVAPQDPVATLARIASRKRPSKQSSQQSSSKLVKPPANQQNFHGVVATASKPNKKFDFDKTLKEFGFDARILSGNSFKSGPVSTPNNKPTKKPFTTFSKPAKNPEVTQTQAPSRNQVNQKSSPSFTSRGIPIISSRPKGKKNEKGLSSLIALAGKPENNPVITNPLKPVNQQANPFVQTTQRPSKPIVNVERTNNRKTQNQQASQGKPPNPFRLPSSNPTNPFAQSNQQRSRPSQKVLNSNQKLDTKFQSSQTSEVNSALGNLQSIADGRGPTFVVKNRARRPSSRAQVKSSKASLSITTQRSFTEPSNLKLETQLAEKKAENQLSETLRSQNANLGQREENNVSPNSLSSKISSKSNRVGIPRKTSSLGSGRPKLFIDEEEFESSEENEIRQTTERIHRKKNSRPKQKKNKTESRKKKPEKIEQRPPVVGGCFHVCETLIFEVYKLLGGSLCDCVR